MPHYQDPGHNGQHAFTAFIHLCSLFVRFTLAPHFDPAQYLKTSHSDRKSQVEVMWVEMRRRRVAVVVTATMPRLPPPVLSPRR
jgi:hypothetical protein